MATERMTILTVAVLTLMLAGTAPGTTADANASPGYNQGDPAGPGDVTAGAAGTVARPETPEAAPLRKYHVRAAEGVDLAAHTGHTVEIEGALKPTVATPPAEPTAREGRGSATAEPTSDMREPVIEATRLRHVAAGCQ